MPTAAMAAMAPRPARKTNRMMASQPTVVGLVRGWRRGLAAGRAADIRKDGLQSLGWWYRAGDPP
jgi:hypothetical protein